MPKRRANGEGNIRKRKDGRWEGRYTVGRDPETGKAIIKNVLGKTQAEVKEKLKKAIEENAGIDYGRAKTYTVGSWLEVWMENYAKIKLRPSTFKTSQGFLKNHIKPQIGSIPLADLTSLDLVLCFDFLFPRIRRTFRRFSCLCWRQVGGRCPSGVFSDLLAAHITL